MNELQTILDGSNATPQQKQAALTTAFQIAVPLAAQATGGQAGGEFLALLMEIVKLLLPLLLKLLGV